MFRKPNFPVRGGLPIAALLLPTSLMICLSCGTAPMKTYYMLENTPSDVSTENEAPLCSLSLGLNPVEVSPPFDISKIVFRPDPLEVRFYTQSQWVSPPEEMFSKLIARRIETSHLFSAVDRSVNVSGPHLSLLVKVYAIEEVDNGKDWHGRLAMNFFLRDEMEDKLLWTHRFDVKEAANKNEVKAVVEILNRIYNREIAAVVASLKGFLSTGGCHLSKSGDGYRDDTRPSRDLEPEDEPDDPAPAGE